MLPQPFFAEGLETHKLKSVSPGGPLAADGAIGKNFEADGAVGGTFQELAEKNERH